MSFLVGKRSKNRAFEQLRGQMTPWMGDRIQVGQEETQRARDALGAYFGGLGLGNEEAFNTGLERFRNASGYQNIFGEAMRGITSSSAARGLMNSGAVIRAMQDRAAQLGDESKRNYLAQILAGSQTGFGAADSAFGAAQGFGNTIAGAGQTGPREGLLGAIGQAAGGAASLIGAFRGK